MISAPLIVIGNAPAVHPLLVYYTQSHDQSQKKKEKKKEYISNEQSNASLWHCKRIDKQIFNSVQRFYLFIYLFRTLFTTIPQDFSKDLMKFCYE